VLWIIAAALFVGIATILWIASLWLQSWLYESPQGSLIPRALASSAVMALFLTAWNSVYKSDPGRIDTVFSYSREKLDGTYNEFLAIKKVGEKELPPVKYVRRGGRDFSTNDYRTADTNKPYNRSDSDGLVVAVQIAETDKREPTRFNANLTKDGKFPKDNFVYADEAGRYMDANTIGKIYRKRPGGILLNLLANALHAALWCVAFWFGMRFSLNHAMAIGLCVWLIVMIGLQPALFGLVTQP
jgi:hypothetical protein